MVQFGDITLPALAARDAADNITIQNVRIPSSKEPLACFRAEILKLMTDLNFSWPAMCAMRIAITEALNNAKEHGNGNDPTKTILVSYQIDSQCVWVAIEDEGIGFDAIFHIADIQRGGQLRGARQGLALIRQCCDEFGITPPGNRIELLKHNA